MKIEHLAPSRAPCSSAERDAAQSIADHFGSLGQRPLIETLQAPTSPTWAPLARALLRMWAAAFLAAGFVTPSMVFAFIAVAGSVRLVADRIRHVPVVGGISQNVLVHIRGTAPGDGVRPVVVVAHLDTHPTDGAPLARWHRFAAALSGIALLAASVQSRGGTGWRAVAGLGAAEAVLTIAWLARRELSRQTGQPDDNTSGLMALERLVELAVDGRPTRDLWVVATGAATSGGLGMAAFLRTRPELRSAWVVDVDALGSGEIVASPTPPRFPRPGTPAALRRAVIAAARSTGDPLAVRRVRRPHSEAVVAMGLRVGAITLTAGVLHPARRPGPDAANAARAARLVYELVRR